MPKAYVMIHLEITNREEFVSGFSSKIPDLLAEFGGKPLVRSGGPNSEGVTVLRLENQVTDRQADIHAIFEFPDKESALAWYDSDQYKAILPARTDNTANTYLAIIDGVDD
ncbi:uncharacterized protein METZ01_LOCUS18853 [marine metagenome]|uniref:DUF1330 domain-containing protein n=1 Tax=marine metagenome TaxID=408172 RepID=A0A381PIR9_9ZZZZ